MITLGMRIATANQIDIVCEKCNCGKWYAHCFQGEKFLLYTPHVFNSEEQAREFAIKKLNSITKTVLN